MGAYAQCWLNDLFVGSSKNQVDYELMSLFSPTDKVVQSPPLEHLTIPFEHYREALVEDSTLKLVYYETSVDVVKDRLDVYGYDLETAKDAFREWISQEHRSTLERLDELATDDPALYASLRQKYESDAQILASLTPDRWIDGLETVRSTGLLPNYWGRYEGPHEGTHVGYMLSNEWYGYPGYDMFVPLRLAMEASQPPTTMIYDVTDLVWSEYYDSNEDFVDLGLAATAADYAAHSKVIVLTEGRVDAWILREALRILFPHLQHHFSFLDFDGTGFGGGVGNLANVVKAFAGAGIANNVVAIFDNDTAAKIACRGLSDVRLPANIVVQRLPPLAALISYPTIGPTGAIDVDVNGMAASIELYLGDDVLRADGHNRTPVQWTGYEKSLGQYQGEIIDKAELHARFREKVRRYSGTAGPEWDSLRIVLKQIFSAFASRNRLTICKRAADYYAR
jgi:hypothetical protein